MNNQVSLGEYLQNRRIEFGLTVAEMAKQLGISCSHYWNIENKLIPINKKHFDKISAVFNVSLTEIYQLIRNQYKECLFCKTIFLPNKKTQCFCSKSCSDKHYKRNNRDKQREHNRKYLERHRMHLNQKRLFLNQKFKIKYDKNKSKGLCVKCNSPLDREGTLCSICAEKRKELEIRNLASEKCCHCGKEGLYIKTNGQVSSLCISCYKKRSSLIINTYYSRKKQGICVVCGVNKAFINEKGKQYIRCEKCNSEFNEYQNERKYGKERQTKNRIKEAQKLKTKVQKQILPK